MQEFPVELCQLRSLRTLRLCFNQISVLPPSIGQLSVLQNLDLQGNLLCGVPVQLGACVELNIINLLQNPLTDAADPGNSSEASIENPDITFCEVYFGTHETPEVHPTERVAVVKRGTRSLMECLRQQLDPEECGQVRLRLEEIQQAEASARLERAIGSANKDAIAAAVAGAQRAGVKLSLVEKGQDALPVLDELEACVESGSASHISAALKAWEMIVAPARPDAPQYIDARLALRKLQRQQAVKPWRSVHGSGVMAGRVSMWHKASYARFWYAHGRHV